MQYQRSVFLLCVLCGFLFACNSTKHIPDGEYLLVKNNVKPDSSALPVEKFEYYIKQKPNRKFLGFRLYLSLWNVGASGKDNKFKHWLRNIGEEPVIYDSTLTDVTRAQFKLFLNKNGYFNANVSDTLDYPAKKKVTVNYFVQYNEPYKIRSISYSTQDSGISPLMNYFQQTSLIIPGDRYDEEVMENERERITNDLRDRGYYFFTKSFITIQVDSAFGTHQADIYLYINRVNENIINAGDQTYSVMNHNIYTLRNIYIQTDFNLRSPSQNPPLDTTFYNGYYLISASKYRVLRDNVIARNIFVKSGDTYLPRDVDFTYTRLQQLNVFSFINLLFKEVDSTSAHQLDLFIQLTPSDKQDFTVETEMTNTGGNLGLAGSFALRNKNTWRGAEVLEFRLRGGLEAIPNFNEDKNKTFYFFNTYEIGPEVTLSLKKFLLPEFLVRNTSRFSNTRTNFNTGYNFEKRPDYQRSITNVTVNYQYDPTRSQRFILFPFDFNSVQVNLSDEFASKLADLKDPRLFYTYQTHVITSLRLTWVFNNQKTDKAIDFFYFRSTGEFAYKLAKEKRNPSQYAKVDFDFSFHKYVNAFNNIVYRLAAGYGLPYGTSSALPFEKSFFAGGANSIRAWNTNTLGPGSYPGDINIEQSGDIKVETNIEYRSEFIRFQNNVKLEAAAFVDAGNIWTRNEDVSRPGGKFDFAHMIEEMGVGAGIGLRFNFSFFIFRLDGAVKLRNPAYPENERWVYPNHKFILNQDVVLNFAIGYPF